MTTQIKELNRFHMGYFFPGAHFSIVNNQGASSFIEKIKQAHVDQIAIDLPFKYKSRTETMKVEIVEILPNTGAEIYDFRFNAKIITARFNSFRIEGYYRTDKDYGGFTLKSL